MDKNHYLNDVKNIIENKTYKYMVFNKKYHQKECLICSKEISDKKSAIHDGYYPISGIKYAWICPDCFNKYHDELNINVYDSKNISSKYNNVLEFLSNELNSTNTKEGLIFNLESLLSIIENCDDIAFTKINISICPIIYLKGCFNQKRIYTINKHLNNHNCFAYEELKEVVSYYSKNKNIWDDTVNDCENKVIDHQYYLLFKLNN